MNEIKIELLKNATNLQELKQLYFQLSKKYHPDMETGDLKIMQQLNNEYDYLKTILKNSEHTKRAEQETEKTMEGFKKILDILLKYPNLKIELIGSWAWISGYGTFDIKDDILYNKLHCKYSKANKKFYWFEGIEEQQNFKCKGGYLKKAIDKFGITEVKSEGKKVLAIA